MKALPDSIPARGAAASRVRSPRIWQLVQQSFAAMTARERARLIAMYGVIAGLHVAGSVILFVFVVPSALQGAWGRGGGAGLHARLAARLRRRLHLGDR